MKLNYRFLGLVLAMSGLALTSCGDDNNPLGGDGGPGLPGVPGGGGGKVPEPFATIAKACGIDVDCKGGGIAEGNASISGVASIDAVFQSVLNFQAKADNISAGADQRQRRRQAHGRSRARQVPGGRAGLGPSERSL